MNLLVFKMASTSRVESNFSWLALYSPKRVKLLYMKSNKSCLYKYTKKVKAQSLTNRNKYGYGLLFLCEISLNFTAVPGIFQNNTWHQLYFLIRLVFRFFSDRTVRTLREKILYRWTLELNFNILFLKYSQKYQF